MTAHEEQRSFPRMMIMITHAEDEKKLEKVLTALNIPVLPEIYLRISKKGDFLLHQLYAAEDR